MQVLKIGGSVLDASGLEALAAELRPWAEQLVVVHGAGRRPRAQLPPTREGRRIPASDAAAAARVQRAVAEVHGRVMHALRGAGLEVEGVGLADWARTDGTGRLEAVRLEVVRAAFAGRRVPVLHGDVLAEPDGAFRIVSSDEVVECVASRLGCSQVVWATDVDGVLAADGSVLPRLEPGDLGAVQRRAADAGDATGAMSGKIDEALRLAAGGVPSWIVNGCVPGRVAGALRGQPQIGTRIERIGLPPRG